MEVGKKIKNKNIYKENNQLKPCGAREHIKSYELYFQEKFFNLIKTSQLLYRNRISSLRLPESLNYNLKVELKVLFYFKFPDFKPQDGLHNLLYKAYSLDRTYS